MPAPILISGQAHIGGIAEHTHHQAQELSRRGHRVIVLCHPDFLKRDTQPLYQRLERLRRVDRRGLLGRIGALAAVVVNHWLLAWYAWRLRPQLVLMDCASEYFTPLWVWPHLLLRRLGRIYLANFHDPVRIRLFGPEWLHRWSVTLMYAMLDGGLVHGPVPDAAGLPARLRVQRAPLGCAEFADQGAELVNLREELDIPPAAPVVLSFGHVSDRKNVDLLIDALARLPDVHLIVAGSSNSSAQKQVADYRGQASRRGVTARVHFVDRFIADAEIPNFFTSADIVALTYCREFVSQSAVLQHAAVFRRPVIASSGPGPLRESMEHFAIGELIEPDDVNAIVAGLARMIANPVDREPAFAAFCRTASWAVNIGNLLDLLDTVRRDNGWAAPA